MNCLHAAIVVAIALPAAAAPPATKPTTATTTTTTTTAKTETATAPRAQPLDPVLKGLAPRKAAIAACQPATMTAPATVTVRWLPARAGQNGQKGQAMPAKQPPTTTGLKGLEQFGLGVTALPPAVTDPAVIGCVVQAIADTPPLDPFSLVGDRGLGDRAYEIVVQLDTAVTFPTVSTVRMLTKDEILAVLSPTYPTIARCTDARTARDPGPAVQRKIIFDFDIARDGTVVVKKLTPDVPDPLAICTREATKHLVFPWPGDAPFNVKIPIVLTPATASTTTATATDATTTTGGP